MALTSRGLVRSVKQGLCSHGTGLFLCWFSNESICAKDTCAAGELDCEIQQVQSPVAAAAAASSVMQNELSGSILPDNGLPRRVRDPRAMRNDYGRLPYHLAMRKSFTWLAELLDPSVPVRWVLSQRVSWDVLLMQSEACCL